MNSGPMFKHFTNARSVRSIPILLNSKVTRKSTEAINQGSVETHALPSCSGCVFTAVSVHLDGLNAEDKFRVWVTILGHTPLPFPFPLSLEQQRVISIYYHEFKQPFL